MNYYTEIKNELINNEIYKKVKDYSKNKSNLKTYYNVGKLLSEAGRHYGEGIIKKYSVKLTNELGKGYDLSNLKRMRKFYYLIEKGVAMPHHLSWSHILALLPINSVNKINYYVNICECYNLSYRKLRDIIKNNDYERLPNKTKEELLNKENERVDSYIKNPIIIKNTNNYDKFNEKVLQKLILEDISSFLRELGEGFSFIDNEYKIKMGNTYNYIDLLLYNIKYNCYVVIELKVNELKKEHIGQIKTYMNYVDKNIGIIICKKDNKFIMEYCSDKRILTKEYIIITN